MCWFKFVFLIRVLELVNYYFLTITSDVLIFFLSSIFLICGFQGTFDNIVLLSNGDNEIRTRDLLLARQALSQLSYTPKGFIHLICFQ